MGWRRKAPSATPSAARSSGASRWQGAGRRVRPLAVHHGVLASASRSKEVWPAELLAKAGIQGQDLFDVLYKNGKVNKFPPPTRSRERSTSRTTTTSRRPFGFYLQKGLFEEYAEFRPRPRHDLAPSTPITRCAACAGRWSTARKPVALPRGYDPYVKAGEGVGVLRLQGRQGQHLRRCPTSLPPKMPDKDFDLWLCTGRVLEHWHTGSMTRRAANCTAPCPRRWCSCTRTTPRARHPARHAGEGRQPPRRDPAAVGRDQGPQQGAAAGLVFVPFFDEGRLVNKLTLDATCPISKETDFKKCAVKVVTRLIQSPWDPIAMDLPRRAPTAAPAPPACYRRASCAPAARRLGRALPHGRARPAQALRPPGARGRNFSLRLRPLRPVRARLPAGQPEALQLAAGRMARRRRHRHAIFRGARDPCEMCEASPA